MSDPTTGYSNLEGDKPDEKKDAKEEGSGCINNVNTDGEHDLSGVGSWDFIPEKVILVRRDSSPPGRVEEFYPSELTKEQVIFYYDQYWCANAGAYKPIDEAFLMRFKD